MSGPEIHERKTDAQVAKELGCSVRWLRTHVLDVTPHSHLRIGRRRYLLPRHVEIVVKTLENQASVTRFRVHQASASRPAATSKTRTNGALEEALKFARGK